MGKVPPRQVTGFAKVRGDQHYRLVVFISPRQNIKGQVILVNSIHLMVPLCAGLSFS